MALPVWQTSPRDERGSAERWPSGGSSRDGVMQVQPSPDSGALDATAVSRVVVGDSEALRELYDRYGRMTYAIAYRVLGDDHTAEECVQDVFVELWRHASRYDPRRGRVSTWLCTITRNRAIDAARARERRAIPSENVEPSGYAADTAELVTRADEAVRVAEAMASLPPVQLEVVQLAHFEGFTQSEIAQRLGIPLGTVKSRMRGALDRLRSVADELRPEDAR
jgi:RNA polymerase sigma-70 factor (ECF subfamily)